MLVPTGGQRMKTQKPAVMAIATSVLMAGIGNALIYSLGYAALVGFKFITQDSGDATFGSFLSAFIITLVFTMLLVEHPDVRAGLPDCPDLPHVRLGRQPRLSDRPHCRRGAGQLGCLQA